jgi:hypothetical protein
MARNLGQAVSLQRLAIDEEAMVTPLNARPEASETQEHEQYGEQRPVRDRKHFSPDQERGRPAQLEHDSDTASGMKRREKKRVTNRTPARTPAWQPEDSTLPERPYSGKAKDDRRGTGKQSSFGRTTGKHKAHAFATMEPQRPAARRKPRATPEAQVRRPAASKRSASR